MSASSTKSPHMVAELGMAESTGEQPVDLSAIGSRRAAWRITTCVEQKEIHDGIVALMDENLIPSASTGQPKAFCYEMKGNYH